MRISMSDNDEVDIQMTPMIDCVFLLLIFFLVATVLKKIEEELPIELPESAAAIEVKKEDDLLVVGVDVDGRYYLGSAPVTVDVLHNELREAAKADKTQRIRVDCDRDARMSSYMQLRDILAFEGLKNVGIHTRPSKKKR